MSVEDKIWNFILDKLEPKGIKIDSVECKSEELFIYFYRFTAMEGDKKHIFTVLLNEDESKKLWYESAYFDESMDQARRDEIVQETSVEAAVKEYFKQEFDIDVLPMTRSFLFKWS